MHVERVLRVEAEGERGRLGKVRHVVVRLGVAAHRLGRPDGQLVEGESHRTVEPWDVNHVRSSQVERA